MTIHAILNSIIINEMIGTSGQPLPSEFQIIAQANYKTVINLAMPDSDNALPEEGAFVSEAGMTYIHLPVPFDTPTKEHLTKFLQIMKSLEDEKVWVHCALNYRVSAFMYHYQRSILKRTEKECIPMIDEWVPDEVWQQFLRHNV